MIVTDACSYLLAMRLQSFCELSVDQGASVLRHLVEAMAICDEEYLRAHNIPLLYDSGVRYVRDSRFEQQWWDVPAVLSKGYADCKALSAWRLAELRIMGINARLRITYTQADGFHITIEYGLETEDPSAILAYGKKTL